MAVGPDPISSASRRSSPPFVLRPRSNRLVVDAGANVDAIAAPSWTRAQEGRCEPPAGTLPMPPVLITPSTSGYLVSSLTWFDESAFVGENDRLHAIA